MSSLPQDTVACSCPACGNLFAVKTSFLGRQVRCPVCSSIITAARDVKQPETVSKARQDKETTPSGPETEEEKHPRPPGFRISSFTAKEDGCAEHPPVQKSAFRTGTEHHENPQAWGTERRISGHRHGRHLRPGARIARIQFPLRRNCRGEAQNHLAYLAVYLRTGSRRSGRLHVPPR